jgi:hypothetical protein
MGFANQVLLNEALRRMRSIETRLPKHLGFESRAPKKQWSEILPFAENDNSVYVLTLQRFNRFTCPLAILSAAVVRCEIRDVGPCRQRKRYSSQTPM